MTPHHALQGAMAGGAGKDLLPGWGMRMLLPAPGPAQSRAQGLSQGTFLLWEVVPGGR